MDTKAVHRRTCAVGLAILALAWFGLASPAAATEEAATLPLQTRGYSQAFQEAPAAWGDDALGTSGCPDTIATTGCLVTAFACVLDYYGIEVVLPASGGRISGSDPGALNAWLKENGGYGHCASDGAGNCCLEWSRLPPSLALRTYYNTSETGIDLQAVARINSALAQGKPVIAGVHWGQPCGADPGRSEDCHWVVITAQAYGTVVILDPYNPDGGSPHAVRTTLDRGVHGSYVIDRYVVVDAPAASPRATSIVVSVSPGSQPLIGNGMQLVAQTANVAIDTELFFAAIDPQGNMWSILPGTEAAEGRWIRVTAPTGFSVEPHEARVWRIPLPEGISPAQWTWKAWLSDPLLPGVPLSQDTLAAAVTSSSSVSGLGVFAAIALFAATLTLMIWLVSESR